MRVAIIFAGLPRLIPSSMLKWQQFAEAYNADVFVHAWEDPRIPEERIVHGIVKYLKPRALMIEPQKKINIDLYNDRDRIWPYRSSPMTVMSMWYSINSGFNLCKKWSDNKGLSYDIVCRARFDWWCENITLSVNQGLTVPDDPGLAGHGFSFRGERYIAHNDQFGYGSQDVMQEYANTYKRIPSLFMDEMVDFCSELFLTANMLRANIPVHYQTMSYRILR